MKQIEHHIYGLSCHLQLWVCKPNQIESMLNC